MKRVRERDGRVRLWFDEGEIDILAERELKASGLMPTIEEPIVDIERFVERHLGAVMNQYAELEDDVLGVTRFAPGARTTIDINQDLTGAAIDREDPLLGVLGRWRATIAHEAGHVLLHSTLFANESKNLDLFATHRGEDNGGDQRCLKRDLSYGRSPDWREFQANQAMASLLMPRSLFPVVARECLALSFPGHDSAASAEMIGELAPLVAKRFQVSRQAARIRILELAVFGPLGQQKL